MNLALWALIAIYAFSGVLQVFPGPVPVLAVVVLHVLPPAIFGAFDSGGCGECAERVARGDCAAGVLVSVFVMGAFAMMAWVRLAER